VFEDVAKYVEQAKSITVVNCACRTTYALVGDKCEKPMDICMTFNATAESLTKHSHARRIDQVECMDLLQKAYDSILVQFGENVRQEVNFICNCCGCCCEAMIAARRFAILNPVHTTNFIPEIDLKYQKIYAYLQDDITRKSPTIDLIYICFAARMMNDYKPGPIFLRNLPCFCTTCSILLTNQTPDSTPY
jgi:hypothetical protein